MSWLSGKRIVVPTDFSAGSINAVDWVRTLVRRPQDLYVVHVAPIDVGGDLGFRGGEYAERLLENLMHDDVYAGVNHSLLMGDPGSSIADYAKQIDADMIVMPSQGKTGLAHLLVGSVAERVLRFAHCPVLVLRN